MVAKKLWVGFKDGRWVAYYHPGDIGDAWADGHAGVSQDIWANCYRLGSEYHELCSYRTCKSGVWLKNNLVEMNNEVAKYVNADDSFLVEFSFSGTGSNQN